MYDLNATLLALPLGIVAAQHLEGDTTALVGSYETGFYPFDDVVEGWPLPNVLGVKPR